MRFGFGSADAGRKRFGGSDSHWRCWLGLHSSLRLPLSWPGFSLLPVAAAEAAAALCCCFVRFVLCVEASSFCTLCHTFFSLSFFSNFLVSKCSAVQFETSETIRRLFPPFFLSFGSQGGRERWPFFARHLSPCNFVRPDWLKYRMEIWPIFPVCVCVCVSV